MRKPFTEPLTKDEMEYLLQKFKTYLGSVSREIQNRKLKENKEHFTQHKYERKNSNGLHFFEGNLKRN